jgi:hypothetical protein
MPVLDDEPGSTATRWRTGMVEHFRAGRMPMETFTDGVAVVRC